MTRPSLKSRFGEQIRAFVGYKNSLGFPYNESIRILGRFDDFCVERFPEKDCLDCELALAWLEKRDTENTAGHRNRIMVIREFAKYLRAVGTEAYMIPISMTSKGPRYVPHIFNEAEIKAFFHGADSFRPHGKAPARHLVIPGILQIAVLLRIAARRSETAQEGKCGLGSRFCLRCGIQRAQGPCRCGCR